MIYFDLPELQGIDTNNAYNKGSPQKAKSFQITKPLYQAIKNVSISLHSGVSFDILKY